jgi:hypothetical protein
MYPNSALVKKTAIGLGVAAAIFILMSLFLWFVTGQSPGTIVWFLPLLALAPYQWIRGAKFESIRNSGRSGVASATGYPGFGKLAVRVVPDDGSAPFDAVITGGTAGRPALGATRRAFFLPAGPSAFSVVLGEQVSAAPEVSGEPISVTP